MSHDNFHLNHRFLKEKEMNEMYLSIFIVTLAESLIGIFVPIYLFKLGYSIPSILFFYFLSSLYFIVLAYPAAKIVGKIGLKHSMLVSTPFLVLYYLGFNFVLNVDYIFYLLPLLLALRMLFFNFGFHLNYIEHSDKKRRGKELSLIRILTSLATTLGPLIAGFIIFRFNFTLLFLVGSLMLFLGIFPLFLTKDSKERQKVSLRRIVYYFKNKRNSLNLASFFGYGIEVIIWRALWPIFLILILTTAQNVGIVTTLGLVSSVVASYIFGRVIDKYDRSKLLNFTSVMHAIAWVSTVLAVTPLKIFAVETFRNLTGRFLFISWSAREYDIESKTKYFSYMVSREISFNISRIFMLPVLMLLFYINYHPFLLSFLIASVATLCYPLLRDVK